MIFYDEKFPCCPESGAAVCPAECEPCKNQRVEACILVFRGSCKRIVVAVGVQGERTRLLYTDKCAASAGFCS